MSVAAVVRRCRRQAGEETRSSAASCSGPDDDEVVYDAGGSDAGSRGAAGGDRADAQAGGRRLGQRADVDDVAVGILGRERRRRIVVERQVACIVVLDQEGARLAHDAQQLRATIEGQ